MKNRKIYSQDPTKKKLVNKGVACLDSQEPEVLRHELETFVCQGQYEKGMEHILQNYLKDIGEPKQSAAWVSGFYGSGKSHLVKMLGVLWTNEPFEDGATPRGIADLPESIEHLLHELDVEKKRHGGFLSAVSGILSGGGGERGNVQMAFLRMVFASVGLPTQYATACFALWLKKEGLWDTIKQRIEKGGGDWQSELEEFRVSEELHKALVDAKPGTFPSPENCGIVLCEQFPLVEEISSEDMLDGMKKTLIRNGEFPLTLVVLDELQQYIGDDSDRSAGVQEMVETCCSKTGGRLLFIGTGQTAISGTSNLKKLEGRFPVRVELSDVDVDKVVRQVILAKQPTTEPAIREVIENNLGEITRHLRGTSIAHRQEDKEIFVQDYPILPVRRRFWQKALRALDRSGTDSQLRNQLSMVLRAVCENADRELGCVPPADFLYFDVADRLLQSQALPREAYDKTMFWHQQGNEEERLMARACGLVFLINQLDSEKELGIHATVDTLSDLLVEDLAQGSENLRSRLPELLAKCELLMVVGDQYRIKTVEYSEWDREFKKEKGVLSSNVLTIDSERNDSICKKFKKLVSRLSVNQGEAKVPRIIEPIFNEESAVNEKKVCVSALDGWSQSEKYVLDKARRAGTASPGVFVYLHKRSSDRLRRELVDFKAAEATLAKCGVPASEGGKEARKAVETIRGNAESMIDGLLDELFAEALVFQAGGSKVHGDKLHAKLQRAIEVALKRLYPKFHIADHWAWDRVYERGQKGSPDALQAVGYEGKVPEHPVCQALLGDLGGGSKRGADIRGHFESPPFGWSREAVDAGLLVLLSGGWVSARDEVGQEVTAQQLRRNMLNKTRFEKERAVVKPQEHIEIRALFQIVDLHVQPGGELKGAENFLDKMHKLAQDSGGEAPRPECPDVSLIKRIRSQSGNERLLSMHKHRQKLTDAAEKWKQSARMIKERLPQWEQLEKLLKHAKDMVAADREGFLRQAGAIREQRQLLKDPDPVAPLMRDLSQKLREQLQQFVTDYKSRLKEGHRRLNNDVAAWRQLSPTERTRITAKYSLGDSAPLRVSLENSEGVLKTLERYPLHLLLDQLCAVPTRFDEAMKEAARSSEPDAQFVSLPRGTLNSEAEIDAWAEDAKSQLKSALQKGPVVIQ